MTRREFITLLGGVAATWPLVARAQQRGKVPRIGFAPHETQAQNAAMPHVGWIWPGAAAGNPTEVAGFKQGLRELGYVEGRNIVVEYRFGENRADRLLELAADLARLNVSVIVAMGTAAIRAVQRAAPDTPIVFLDADPTVLLLDASHPYPTDWPRVAELALRHKLPAISEIREFVAAGGLMSYGASLLDMTRRMARHLDKILKGAGAGDLPVEQPTKFELAINLKTAKALGLTVPPTLFARADEVIE